MNAEIVLSWMLTKWQEAGSSMWWWIWTQIQKWNSTLCPWGRCSFL